MLSGLLPTIVITLAGAAAAVRALLAQDAARRALVPVPVRTGRRSR